MKNSIAVDLGELIVSDDADTVIVAFGLGSCVAVMAYDPVNQKGAVLHAVLPAANAQLNGARGLQTKYVDSGIEHLLANFPAALRAERLIVKIVGGAQMFPDLNGATSLNIGERNVEATRNILQERKITIRSSRVGGTNGRTARLYVATGEMTVRSIGEPEENF